MLTPQRSGCLNNVSDDKGDDVNILPSIWQTILKINKLKFDKKLLFYRLSIRSEKYTVKGKNMAGGEGKEGVF
ncbi:MAG: hypothetical protein A2Y79_11570 [Deltaproteobacteria bacterium RBG_13_43_22]|nr:MAG: hypothetical protein A2Y79_11570 [Deltaproteobacteria bacterium RBG_13_43_22]